MGEADRAGASFRVGDRADGFGKTGNAFGPPDGRCSKTSFRSSHKIDAAKMPGGISAKKMRSKVTASGGFLGS